MPDFDGAVVLEPAQRGKPRSRIKQPDSLFDNITILHLHIFCSADPRSMRVCATSEIDTNWPSAAAGRRSLICTSREESFRRTPLGLPLMRAARKGERARREPRITFHDSRYFYAISSLMGWALLSTRGTMRPSWAGRNVSRSSPIR